MSKRRCPICKTAIVVQEWHDEVFGASYCVETFVQCPSGHYQDHYSYGQQSITVGQQEFGWTHHTDQAEVEAIQKQVDAAIKDMKTAFRRPA